MTSTQTKSSKKTEKLRCNNSRIFLKKDIDDILAYTSNPPAEPAADAKKDAKATDSPDLNTVNAAKTSEGNAKIVMISLFAIAGLLIWILFKIRQLVNLTNPKDYCS